MGQILMDPLVKGQHQRARGLKLKSTLQFAALLAICIWLLYQIKHPHGKSSPSKYLGHKLNMRWLSCRNESDSEEGKFARDDQLAKSQEEKASVVANGKHDQRNFETHLKDFNGDGVTNLNKERHDDDSVNEGYQDSIWSFMHSSQENIQNKAEIDVEINSRGMEGKDVTVVLKETDENNLWQQGTEYGLGGSSFDDENGVPFGVNDV